MVNAVKQGDRALALGVRAALPGGLLLELRGKG